MILYVRKVKGAVLISIIASTILALIVQAFAHIDRISDTNPTGWGQTVPELKGSPIAVPVFDTLGKAGPLRRLRQARRRFRDPAGLLAHAR